MSPIQPALFDFFTDLRNNNNRDWFLANKWRYEACVKDPLLTLITDFAAPLADISAHFNAIPKVGGSLFRIYRDIRFSKDKRPYKTAAGVHFRHKAGKNAHAPGFYLHLGPGECFAAVGLWGPDTRTLNQIRQTIVNDSSEWERVTTDPDFSAIYTRDLHADSLKRAPRGFDPDHRFVDDLKRRHFVASSVLTESDICKSDFLEELARRYQIAAGFMEFLTTSVGLPW